MVLYKRVNGKRIQLSPEEEAETLAMWAAADEEAQSKVWLHSRQNEYPEIESQLDMLWHELDIYGTIEKAGPWYTAIKAVKDKYPKPE